MQLTNFYKNYFYVKDNTNNISANENNVEENENEKNIKFQRKINNLLNNKSKQVC